MIMLGLMPFSHLPGQLYKKRFHQRWKNTGCPWRRQKVSFDSIWVVKKGT